MGLLQNMSVERKGLRYKLLISFALMSIIPLLVMMYLVVNHIFLYSTGQMFQVSTVVLFVLWISWTGYILTKSIILPVIDLALETRIIAEGQYDSRVSLSGDDEVGEIARAVNTMTDKMRGYLDELQEYSKETASLNVRIRRKVHTITNLIRLGDLISSGTGFKEISHFASVSMTEELYNGFCAVFVKEADTGDYSSVSMVDNSGRDAGELDIEAELPALEKFFSAEECLVVDSRPATATAQEKLREKLGKVNIILFPMRVKGSVVGAIVLGNFEDKVEFNDEDIEVMRAFERELVLGYQSLKVAKRIESLESVDALTGLYTLAYIEDRLDDEITRALYYQRPCSFILVSIDGFQEYSRRHGESRARQMLKKVGIVLAGSAPPVGKVGRSDLDEFGMLLPEKNKRESIGIAEEIRKKVELMEISPGTGERVTVSIGVGENPIDGSNAKEIIARAREYMNRAREQGKNKVLGE